MERGSAQHGSRLDDELAHEAAAVVHGAVVPSRERGELEPEALTEDEQVPSGAFEPAHAQVVARSELAGWLLPSAFPAGAATLAEVARGQDAPDEMLTALGSLPAAAVYETVGELWVALGGETEHRATHADEPVAVDAAPTPDAHRTALVAPPPDDSIAHLVLLPARFALGALRFVFDTVGRGLSTLTTSHQSS
jgi:hypothetical protein